MAVANRPLRVLVVDDEQIIADTLVTIFRNNGFDVASAYSGYSAIQIANRWEPDVIISDVLMPGLNGVDAALSIYQRLPNIKFVFVSGCSGFQENLSTARNRGLRFIYLEKPVPPKFLVGYLENCQNYFQPKPVCPPAEARDDRYVAAEAEEENLGAGLATSDPLPSRGGPAVTTNAEDFRGLCVRS